MSDPTNYRMGYAVTEMGEAADVHDVKNLRASGEINYGNALERGQFAKRCQEWHERGLMVSTWKVMA